MKLERAIDYRVSRNNKQPSTVLHKCIGKEFNSYVDGEDTASHVAVTYIITYTRESKSKPNLWH